MTDILALYRGRTVAEAELVAVTAQPDLVKRFARELTAERDHLDEKDEGADRAVLRPLRDDER